MIFLISKERKREESLLESVATTRKELMELRGLGAIRNQIIVMMTQKREEIKKTLKEIFMTKNGKKRILHKIED